MYIFSEKHELWYSLPPRNRGWDRGTVRGEPGRIGGERRERKGQGAGVLRRQKHFFRAKTL